MLSHKLTSHGINVVQAKADADTIIVKTALDIRQNQKVNVAIIADDTDILCLMIHHVGNCIPS